MAAKLKSALLRAPRRTWSVEERRRIVDEALSAGASVARVARRHGLNANLVFKWIGGALAFADAFRIPSDHARLPRRDPPVPLMRKARPPKPAAAASAHEWLRRRHLIN